ncbi:hypothetical protein B0H17DRAFT_1059213 [Mycena rosella]|uniref:Transcription factor tau subunit sfc3/Tfc3 C-terminal domain-containing protein n=1 Tax=Mycena rosella TaxID=1033263 RepID=A0AAD7DN98_MYCRO|nr:hypothetical protein B0H17DRAFT_1059213 [Mycena rosella]
MDELLHHCLRELSFDGDLGCNVSRLRDFVVDFYAHSTTTSAQNPDDAFCAFVWSIVVQQPTVIIGTVPEGITSEVWIAPQNSAKKKAKAKGEELVEIAPPRLDIVPDAKNRSLDDLKAEYGDKLRLAADPEATYAAITGTHIRFPKMSGMVYSALQIITRGRDAGVSVVELGQRSKYDQKTCFYLVRQLTELDLIVKVRRGGVGSHFCIHKYFFDRSASWKAIREEETLAEAEAEAPSKQVTTTDVQDEEESVLEARALNFSPIDARHLSSMPLVKARVIKLLKASKNFMHASSNMLIAIGFAHPTKTDRRFFASRTRELVEQRVIENIFVPGKKKKALNSGVKCFRLVSADPEQAAMAAQEGVVVEPDEEAPPEEQSAIKMNLTIHKQIVTLLEESGTVGMTLNEIAAALCHFDKRTIELLLTRAEKYPPPPHLSDLGIAMLMESSGRERRHRYFTVASYHALVAQENLDKSSAGYADVELSLAGEFLPFKAESFYTNEADLIKHQDRDARTTRQTPGKVAVRTNPILPDGTVKKGRPRKARPEGEEFKPRKPPKRKLVDDDAAGPSEPKKGPPAKKRRVDADQASTDELIADFTSNPEPLPVPKKRGRSSKNKAATVDGEDVAPAVRRRGPGKKFTEPAASTSSAPKKRGRRPSPKNKDVREDTEEIIPPESQNAPSPPSKRPRLQSPYISAFDTPLTPLSTDDSIPPVTILAQSSSSSAPSRNSTPFLETTIVFDELYDDRDVDDRSTAIDANAMPLSPTLLTMSLLDHFPMHVDSQESGTPQNTPIDPTLLAISGVPQPTLPEASSNLFAIDTPVAVLPAIKPQKVNVSSLRREIELFRVLESLGGIANTQTKELFEAHVALVISLAQAGEATSAPPGTRLDRRTATAAFNNMELNGRVKQLKTTVSSLTGLTRSANLVYLPHIDESQIAAFLADLGRNTVHFPPFIPNAIVVDEHTEYGSKFVRAKRRPKIAPAQLLQAGPRPGTRLPNPDRADELFAHDEETIREVLLTERTTLGQMYGYIVGKIVRTREFHLFGLNVFETRVPSPNIVSHEKRIAAFPYFYNDLPVGLYCAIVAAIDGSEELSRHLSTELGRKVPVRDLPASIHSLLQIGRTRGRGRVLELLDILRSLGLAVPLEPSDPGSTPFITCAANGVHPTSFQLSTNESWSKEATVAAPGYWHFTSVGTVYHWAESEANPPFLRDVPITSCADAVQYWNFLRTACHDRDIPVEPNRNAPPRDMALARKKAKTLRRRVSWTDGYTFTWHQTHYIKRFISGFPAQSPLHLDPGAADKVQNICRVVSAPEHAVREFLAQAHAAKIVEIEKANRRIQKELQTKAVEEETKASLARKAADARANRETKWDNLVQRVHPDPLADAAALRLRRVKTLFLQATGMQTARWEREIAQAVHEVGMATNVKMLPSKRYRWNKPPPPAPTPAVPSAPLPAPPVVANPPEKPIAALIAAQGPLVVEKNRNKRKNPPAEVAPVVAAETSNSGPRTRFHWNRDYDELAKDAFAIILSRCRTRGKVDYGAIKQAFPGVSKVSVRLHMKTIREEATMSAYLSRLEDYWHALWMKYRGSALLPDEDPLSPTKFDLIAHIEFLRKHIDKNALRVGFAEVEEKEKNTIPASIEELFNQFDVVETPGGTPAWDFMWSAVVDEGREKRSLRQAFTTRPDELVLGTENSVDRVLLAESALKMVMGTAQEDYEPEPASRMLHSIGEQTVNAAQKNLLSRGVLSRRFKIPSSHPGRMLKISDTNQNAIGGSIPSDTFQDAFVLEEISVEHQAWREWPLLSTDGDTAALIQLVSDNKVDFRVDTTQAQAARAAIDWNSKKADDDDIETAIFVRFHDVSIPQTPNLGPPVALPAMEIETVSSHGATVDGSPACCKRLNEDSLIDCAACLEQEWGALNGSVGSTAAGNLQLILDTVTKSGAKGISKKELLVKTNLPGDSLFAAVQRLTECTVPPMFWAGYASLVLVASSHLRAWTVEISTAPLTRIFPRRWIDMTGSKVMDVWDAAARAVMGVLVFHPGLTQAQLRWRLRSVYDRQEVTEVVRYLCDAGFMERRGGSGIPLDDEEENGVWLFVGSRHWYQV